MNLSQALALNNSILMIWNANTTLLNSMFNQEGIKNNANKLVKLFRGKLKTLELINMRASKNEDKQ
jgi:hypothetical protein